MNIFRRSVPIALFLGLFIAIISRTEGDSWLLSLFITVVFFVIAHGLLFFLMIVYTIWLFACGPLKGFGDDPNW
jgi:hypothetical protein